MNKIITAILIAMGLLSLPGKITQGATLSSTPSAGLTQVTVDQPYGQFTKIGLPGSSLLNMPAGDTFYTDASQVWVADLNGYGSLHTFVLSANVKLIAVRPTYGPDLTTQEFAYEYQINSEYGLLRQQLGPMNLSYGPVNVTGIPEPATISLVALGLISLLFIRKGK